MGRGVIKPQALSPLRSFTVPEDFALLTKYDFAAAVTGIKRESP